jgi:hypothetical protein
VSPLVGQARLRRPRFGPVVLLPVIRLVIVHLKILFLLDETFGREFSRRPFRCSRGMRRCILSQAPRGSQSPSAARFFVFRFVGA